MQGDDRDVLKLRPGITGPATLKYRLEGEYLANARKLAYGLLLTVMKQRLRDCEAFVCLGVGIKTGKIGVGVKNIVLLFGQIG